MIMADIPNQIDIRDAFFDALYDIATVDRNLLFLTADMTAFSLERFKRDLPDQYFNVGVAEQNLISVAAGLALSGKKVFVYAIAPFVTQRCFEQIKVDLCVMDLPVTLVGTGPGICYSSDGPTHHTTEDLGMLRGLPNITIFNPADAVGAAEAARLGLDSNGPAYVRLDKGIQSALHYNPAELADGLILLRPGDDLLLLSSGLMVHRALEVADKLKQQDVHAAVAEAFRIKPFNAGHLVGLVAETGQVVCLEEHSIVGGLGSAVAEALVDAGRREPLLRLALPDAYPIRYGDRDWMLAQAGLSLDQIVARIQLWGRQRNVWWALGTSVAPTQAIPPAKAGQSRLPIIQAESIGAGPWRDLTLADFVDLLGTPLEYFSSETRGFIETTDFSYRVLEGAEEEKVLVETLENIESGRLSLSCPEKQTIWEKGWKENLEDYRKTGDVEVLKPKFVRSGQIMRLKGQFIVPANPNFESAFVQVLREVLFRRWLAQAEAVFEFGSGTCLNLYHLARMFPGKRLIGLDWSQASCEIANELAAAHKLNLSGLMFDMFHPDGSVEIGPNDAVFTIGALEQLGENFRAFLNYLLAGPPKICLHCETMNEIYHRQTVADFAARRYSKVRNYLWGWLTELRERERQGRLKILQVQRVFGGQYHEGYSFVVWRPVCEKAS